MNLDVVVALCKTFEGLHRLGKDGLVYPYICPAGVATIGYGATYYEDGRKVTMADPPITRAQAEQLLLREIRKTYAAGVARLCPGLVTLALTTGNWNPFNAITDFAFNCGVGRLQSSTLRKRLNAQDWNGAKEQLMLYVRGGGKVLPGLVRRRKAEAALL